MRIQTKFGMKIFEIDYKWNFMIFELLTSPQGHQFDPSVAFCSAHHPRQFDVPHDHVQKKKIDSLGCAGTPKSHPGAWGMTQVSEQKSHLVCFIIFKNTHKV